MTIPIPTSPQTLQLPSGRTLDYLITGSQNPDAIPLIYLHGTPSAYPPLPNFSEKCERHNFKLVSFSRAGYGGSTRAGGRRVVDVVGDVGALLGGLGVERCVVGGWSGGGPHVLACAAKLDACVAALCISGVAPWEAEGLDYFKGQGEDNIKETLAAVEGEAALRTFLEPNREVLLKADVAGTVQMMATTMPDIDRKVMLENEKIGTWIVDNFHEALRISADGWVDESLALIRPWGFDLSEIKKPIFLYQGGLDKAVPFGHGQWFAEHLPKEVVRERLLEEEGHMSLWENYIDTWLEELRSVCG